MALFDLFLNTTKLAKAAPIYNVRYELNFEVAIHGPHVYQSKWNHTLNMKFKFLFGKRGEGEEYDESAISVYLWDKEGQDEGLVRHLLIEFN